MRSVWGVIRDDYMMKTNTGTTNTGTRTTTMMMKTMPLTTEIFKHTL